MTFQEVSDPFRKYLEFLKRINVEVNEQKGVNIKNDIRPMRAERLKIKLISDCKLKQKEKMSEIITLLKRGNYFFNMHQYKESTEAMEKGL